MSDQPIKAQKVDSMTEEKPYRGPQQYISGDYAYFCDTEGDFDWFQGKETIDYRGKQIYECFFHGGLIR